MKNRSREVRKTRAAAKHRRALAAYLAGRAKWAAVRTTGNLWMRWKYAQGPLVLYTTFRRHPDDDLPF